MENEISQGGKMVAWLLLSAGCPFHCLNYGSSHCMYQKPTPHKLKGVKKRMYWKDAPKGKNTARCQEGLDRGQQHHWELHLPDVTCPCSSPFWLSRPAGLLTQHVYPEHLFHARHCSVLGMQWLATHVSAIVGFPVRWESQLINVSQLT